MELIICIIKDLIDFIKYIFKGIYYFLFLITYGFFYIIRLIISFIKKLFKSKSKVYKKIDKVLADLQVKPALFFLVLIIIVNICLVIRLVDMKDNYGISTEKYLKSSYKVSENNNFRNSRFLGFDMFGYYRDQDYSNVSLKNIKKLNSDTFSWLMIDGTYVNYPIVKCSNNKFYKSHSLNMNSSDKGWPFMNSKNSKKMDDMNTIFYGKDLGNFNSFSTLDDLTTEKWIRKSNRKIVIFTDNKKYIYEVFSAYKDDGKNDYTKINYKNKMNFFKFLNEVAAKSVFDFGASFSEESKIITIVSDASEKIIVHAVLIKESSI